MAERLLDDQTETPVHAWLAVVRNYERMLIGDLDSARAWARIAIEVGSRCDPAAAAIGRVAEGRILILDGDVTQGLALLDEAGVAATSGDLDPLSTGVVYCELVCALQGLALYDLAEEWTEAMERWSRTNAIGSLHGRCRVHRAEILRLRGVCHDAEVQALLAVEELRPYLRRELGWPLTELGRIRLRMGDITGAEEALLAAHHVGWDAEPGLALVRLAQGDVDTAAASIRDALDSPSLVPSKELPPSTELRRVPLLEAQVVIGIAAGDIDRARSAADELEAVAARFQSKALVACAAVARARVRLAEGDAVEAERLFSEGARLWGDVGAPYEAATARLGLADAHRASGREHQAALELQAARLVLDGIEAALQIDDAVPTEARNVFRREGDYWSLAFDGCTVHVRDLKGMRYLARLLGEPVAGAPCARPRRGRKLRCRAGEIAPRQGTPSSGMRARCSTLERRRHTGVGWPRSRRTSTMRKRAATRPAKRRPMSNVTSSSESCREPLASVAEDDEPVTHRSERGPR